MRDLTEHSPLLFIKTGLPGSTPENFTCELAETYEAERLSLDAIRLELYGNGRASTRNERARIRQEADYRAGQLLTGGCNVVYDGNMNRFDGRKRIRNEIAKPLGAHVILLAVWTPFTVRRQRLIDRHAMQSEGTADDERTVDQVLSIADKMEHMIQWPSHRERYIGLDGRSTNSQLLDKIASYLGQTLPVAPTSSPAIVEFSNR